MNRYPKRPSHFAHKFCRLLTKAAVAQAIGPEACWLLAVVAHQEDAVHYSRPIHFWNEQLQTLCGFGGKSRLVTARRKAQEAGWLEYVEGGKGRPGTYWVLIPEGYQDVADGPCDEALPTVSRPESGHGEVHPVPNQDGKSEMPSQNGTATGRQPDGKPSTFNPIPNPKRVSASADCPSEKLLQKERELIAQWNKLQGVTQNRGKALTSKRRAQLRARLKSAEWLRDAEAAMAKFPLRCQLDGRGDMQADTWKPDLEWFLKPDSVTKILEGKYNFSKVNGNGHIPKDSPARIR